MEIIFNSPKEIVTVPQVTKTVSSITIVRMVDFPQRKTVYAETIEAGRVMLWEGDAYDTIGQWTDTDVENRIQEIYA
jgi:cyanophycinase-like exopeptidase